MRETGKGKTLVLTQVRMDALRYALMVALEKLPPFDEGERNALRDLQDWVREVE